ncbi:TIR domain-containing protein [Mesorhizobium sp. CA12]|nr:TIR domain-containing protein [Mesorhizobium sp. CA12]
MSKSLFGELSACSWLQSADKLSCPKVLYRERADLAYEWDVFISYPRHGQVGTWVSNHFAPVLRECLDSVLPQQPRVFIDNGIETGVIWSDVLKQALLRSRLLVAIWTPPFFRSHWCMSEWESMLAREAFLAGGRPPRGLVYPVVYSDGNHFAQKAKQTQFRRDLTAFTYPYPGFRDSAAYLAFHDAMMAIAADIETHLQTVPPWQADWPIVDPPVEAPPPVALLEL